MVFWLQAALVAEAGTQSTDHNLLLQELALSFPDSHAGANVTVLDFAGSFAEVQPCADMCFVRVLYGSKHLQKNLSTFWLIINHNVSQGSICS